MGKKRKIKMGGQKEMEADSINQEFHDENAARVVESREMEAYQYQFNINNYEKILESLDAVLPVDWPQNLKKYSDIERPEEIAKRVPSESIELVSRMLFRENIRRVLQTERMEQNKVIMLRDCAEAQCSSKDKTEEVLAAMEDEAISGLPSKWPEELKKYRKMTPSELASESVDDDLTDETIDLISDLISRDNLRKKVRAERIGDRKDSTLARARLNKKRKV